MPSYRGLPGRDRGLQQFDRCLHLAHGPGRIGGLDDQISTVAHRLGGGLEPGQRQLAQPQVGEGFQIEGPDRRPGGIIGQRRLEIRQRCLVGPGQQPQPPACLQPLRRRCQALQPGEDDIHAIHIPVGPHKLAQLAQPGQNRWIVFQCTDQPFPGGPQLPSQQIQ